MIRNSMRALHSALETKGDEDDGSALVTKALSDFREAVETRLAAVETKSGDSVKLVDRLDKLEAKFNRPSAANSNVPGADNDNTVTEERKAFRSYVRSGKEAMDVKALVVSDDMRGGYLAPAEVSSEFIRELVEFSPIRNYASVRTTVAPSVLYPRVTPATDSALWEGETEESDETSLGFGQLGIVVHGARTFVDISNDTLADGPQAETEVLQALAMKFGTKEAAAFVNGSGVKQPEGFMSNPDIAATINGHATNLTADKLIDLLYEQPTAYRHGSGAAWAMNGRTLATVRKLKDGQGNYLWQPSYQAGQPETILGKPVIEMGDMPDIASGAFPIIFGDWTAYRIVDRLALSIMSDPYTQARHNITRIHARRRTGGRVLQAERFRKLKMATS